ncbi:hypothetical protein QJS10_CPA10g00070 [Acorus calamus]|uniref:Uncharacterized protein n=1 Tax=Acorus calamus TaxID=4465 RepID=A0AAV9E0V7_ACOCL|nr:hypothetical protein QJS10_CPA10g00070 [Acorus calamus]
MADMKNDMVLWKLSLWDSKTFRPIHGHDDLEPIMAGLGFIAGAVIDGGGWREYVFRDGDGDSPKRPRLPFPRIDGLHVETYMEFFRAVVSRVRHPQAVGDRFHVRDVPFRWEYAVKLRNMRRHVTGKIYVFREGCINQTVKKDRLHDMNDDDDMNDVSDVDHDQWWRKGTDESTITLVKLEDLA